MRLLASIVFVGSLATALPASAECRWGGGRWFLSDEGPWTQSLSMNAGESCQKAFAYNGAVILKRLNLYEQPAHGKLALRKGGYMTYVPNAAFRGSDTFLVEVCGEEGGSARCAKLRFQVSVR